MNKLLGLSLIASLVIAGSYKYTGSTTAAVVLAGGVVKAQSVVVTKKYKRKDCPVCEGKGWYISGDKITKVDCGYCEADAKKQSISDNPKVIVHPPINFSPNCSTGTCSPFKR